MSTKGPKIKAAAPAAGAPPKAAKGKPAKPKRVKREDALSARAQPRTRTIHATRSVREAKTANAIDMVVQWEFSV